jgi:hypothetical protein
METRLAAAAAFLIIGAVVLSGAVVLGAEEPPRDVAGMLNALTERLEAQDKKISQLETKLTDEALQASRHEDIAKIMSEMRADAGQRDALPKWLDNLKFFGDMRLRYEYMNQHGSEAAQDNKDRSRYRFRLRFGFIKTWLDDQMEVGFRLASGSDESGTSTNQTMDNTGGPLFSKKNIWIDRAYAKYSPNAVPGLTLIAGKIPNILEHTDLIWDSDMNPEGAVLAYQRDMFGVNLFTNIGQFAINETTNGHDTSLGVYQVGVRAPLPCGINAMVVGSLYDYEDVEGFTGTNWDRNTRLINVLAKVKFKACGLPWQVYFDWVHNNQENDQTSDLENANDGYAVGVKVGKNKKKGDWSTGYQYKYIEENATLATMNDADFGGTNRKGHVLKTKYNLTDFLTLGGSAFFVQPVTSDGDQEDITLQFDLIWKF